MTRCLCPPWAACLLGALGLLLLTTPLAAVVVPEPPGTVAEKQFRHSDLSIRDVPQELSQLPPEAAQQAAAALAALRAPAATARLDGRTGRWATLTPVLPLLPGRGVGNNLSWRQLGMTPPSSAAGLEVAAWAAFRGFLRSQGALLGIDIAELSPTFRVSVLKDGELIQIFAPRRVDGLDARDTYLSAVISQGNLVLFGARNWGSIDTSTQASISSEEALATLRAHVAPLKLGGSWGKPALELIPVAVGEEGLAYRLAYSLKVGIQGDRGSWEALVDAGTGELLAFEDRNQYATTRKVVGGVLPVTNDGIAPDGVEQAGWPMPYNDVTGGGTTDTGGNLAVCVDGNISSSLTGTFLLMNDNCGAISLTSAGDLDFGTSGGTDCTTPGFGGPGNTHASRTGFYELNKIKEQARGQLPGNGWLQQVLQANMNINSTCNAFWNGTVNFYRSGGGCSNTGEIAGVFDHEWGHGMDANDANPGISSPGEGIADIYMTLRLNTSCVGRNFRPGVLCGGYGDPCTECTGVRDIDWAKRASGQPHDVKSPAPTGIDALCGSGSGTPCGGSTHCEGAVYAEAVYDLIHRDLPAAGADSNLALEIGTRLTYLGAGNVGAWFQCVAPFGGCNADGGYLNYLAADDDNGNINDGTPHMQAIFAAFNRHGIACDTPAVASSGCAGAPATAPAVSAVARDRGASLSWGAVVGAARYAVFRTEGVFACDFGKVKLGETTGTSFEDDGLQNGRDYFYTVIPIGGDDTCMGPASACTTVTPVAGPNLAIDAASATLSFLSGDADAFLDNCEMARFSFDLTNIGTGTQNNVRIVDVAPVSHPSITIDATSVSPSSLAACGVGVGSFDFTADGLAFNDTVVFDVTITSDELAPLTRTATLTTGPAESDFQSFASRTFSYEADRESWVTTEGTFDRTGAGGGGNGTAFYLASSDNLPDQCDVVRSPTIRLASTSTMSLQNQFDIEGLCTAAQGCFPSQWFDRANIGIVDGSGARTVVSPDGGRVYNASGINGTCGTDGQPGWADTQSTWGGSSWSSGALNAGAFAGEVVQLEVRYGTDPLLQGFGFHFDEVTLTDVDVQAPDGQTDVCTVCGDGMCDPGETQCSCPADCGTPPAVETGLCTDTVDNDCDGDIDCADADCAADPACQSNCGDGTCDAGEDCLSCPADCPSFPIPASVCGNGLCEAGDGEDCVTCPADCNGVQTGRPSGRFCCGFAGSNPVGCADSRCTTGGFQCTETPTGGGGQTCCGDLSCQAPEDIANCAIDCDSCGDGTCDPHEDPCSCAADCGLPPATETGLCGDGADNDCDGLTDCGDLADCGTDPLCVCGQKGEICTTGADCCSGMCKSNGTCR